MISMLLTVKDRQRCLKALGFYDGAVDGLEGRQTSRAYTDLQAKYFIKPDDVDGKYGKNTDILTTAVTQSTSNYLSSDVSAAASTAQDSRPKWT